MIRSILIASLFLVCAASTTFADDAAATTWKLIATATQRGNVITLSIELASTGLSNDVPPGVTGPVVSTRSSKAGIVIKQGQSAIMIVDAPDAPKDSNFDSLSDGTKIEVMSIVDQNKILVIASRIKDSRIIWADAQTIESTPATQPSK